MVKGMQEKIIGGEDSREFGDRNWGIIFMDVEVFKVMSLLRQKR